MNTVINYNEKNGNYEIIHNGFSWISDGRRPFIKIRGEKNGKYRTVKLSLMSAREKSTVREEGCITTRLSGFRAFGKMLPFTLVLKAFLKDDNTVCFSVAAENERDTDIAEVYFPAPFNSKKAGKNAYHVDPMRQGFILPDGYLKNIPALSYYSHAERMINTGECYMPLWGRVCDNNMFTAIVETPYDASVLSAYGRHLAFINSVCWQSSLGRLSYERRVSFIFHEKGDYNTVAKDYRKYLKSLGQLITIDEKAEKNPNIKNIIGAPVLHHKIFSKINRKSSFYSKNGTNELLCATFRERAEEMKLLKKAGFEKLYIHTDGWGKNGYDNDHPYILPPCEKAGGFEGFREFADTCEKLGYTFALHDQYRDYYYDSPVYDKEKAVRNIDGTKPYCSIWDGGEHTFLCSAFAKEFVEKTYTELDGQGIKVKGVYLDVFSIMPGDECFHKEHTLTRQQSIEKRGECFDYLNEKGIIMSSEEPGMQLIDRLALVHHGPHALLPQENGRAIGIPIPLGNLIYHDSIMVPWNWFNNWGIPKGEDGDLYGALNAGMPYLHPYGNSLQKIGKDNRTADITLGDDKELKKELQRITPLCRLQERLYNKEMVRHEFLGSYKKQMSVFSDGTRVIIDLDKGTYEINYPENM